MATSGGHLLVPKAMRMIRFALEKTTRIIRDKLPQTIKSIEAQAQPAYARVNVQQPISRVAAIRQNQSRWYSTKQAINSTIRQFSSSTQAPTRATRATYPISRTSQAVGRLTSRTPFASTLRPNLTGGVLSRSAGGYGTGAGRVGGARYFSHTPAAPAEVINNVSQAVRAFWLSGQKARFDGFHARTGEKRFRPVSTLQEETSHKVQMKNAKAPGSYLDFKVNPTITAIGPLSKILGSSSTGSSNTLNCDGLMDMLAIDFARALKDLAAVMNDLKRLATLGDLPILLQNSTTLRVRFPGCDADTVEAICKELGVRRGLVYQDVDFDARTGTELALLFPFAPSIAPSETNHSPSLRSTKRRKREQLDWQDMLSPERPPGLSHLSGTSHECTDVEVEEANPWLSPQSGYSSLHESEQDAAMFFEAPGHGREESQPGEYEGLEGIYRFIEECERARR